MYKGFRSIIVMKYNVVLFISYFRCKNRRKTHELSRYVCRKFDSIRNSDCCMFSNNKRDQERKGRKEAMTDEQQRVYDAAQDVVSAANCFIEAVYNLFNEVIEIVTEAIKSIIERGLKIYRQIKKYNCNNWRRNHKLPLIHRNKKCRHRQDIHQQIL